MIDIEDIPFGTPNIILVNPKTYNDLIAYIEWEKKITRLPIRERKQEITKLTLKQRKGKKVKDLSKRPYDYLLKGGHF